MFDLYFAQGAQFFSDSALWVLFSVSFLSATLLPGGSEAALIATFAIQTFSPITIIAIATLGNTLGGMTNYWLGRLLPNRTQQEKQGHKALQWLHKHGYWALLLSWLPLIGDPLCLAAGWLRMKSLPVLSMIMLGKAFRYATLGAFFYGFF
ncbi:YqaA family protein [Vibrio cincinnatiensis]|uniref:YqaA family protein n=1 Tax=Vibrio cincinnatiensis TaxID=675 RepID=UPI001EDDCE75|nr:YqaA family protein [Vibrio cincinnatiensis]MCG3730822.1 DedA family protein [Vibrio cincinnatiensis]